MTPRILSLILPENSVWRFLRKGRKGIGFNAGALVTRSAAGTEVGISNLAPGDLQTAITADAGTVTKRAVVFSGRTAATAATIPHPSGEIRELLIMNANTSSGIVTVATNPVTTILGAHVAPAAIAINTPARFLSNGTSWYRVQ
jgi:hypothetical protein